MFNLRGDKVRVTKSNFGMLILKNHSFSSKIKCSVKYWILDGRKLKFKSNIPPASYCRIAYYPYRREIRILELVKDQSKLTGFAWYITVHDSASGISFQWFHYQWIYHWFFKGYWSEFSQAANFNTADYSRTGNAVMDLHTGVIMIGLIGQNPIR